MSQIVLLPDQIQEESYGCVTSSFEDNVTVQPNINHLHVVWQCNQAGLRRLTINLSSDDLPSTLGTRFMITLYHSRNNADGVTRELRFRVVLDGQLVIEHNPTLPGNTAIEYCVGFELVRTPHGWAPLWNNEAYISGMMG